MVGALLAVGSMAAIHRDHDPKEREAAEGKGTNAPDER
jgi:hypothetical protein